MAEEGGSLIAESYGRFVSSHLNLEKLKCKLIRNHLLFREILTFLTCFKPLLHFKHFDFELLNCQIGDQEILLIAYGLSQTPQLKHIRFKVIQSSFLSIECIEQCVEKFANTKTLESFDLYFRKLSIFTRDIPRLERLFSRFENINCSFSPQSVWISKK